MELAEIDKFWYLSNKKPQTLIVIDWIALSSVQQYFIEVLEIYFAHYNIMCTNLLFKIPP